MAVTQYIGARYVPIFADPEDWTSDREYEPLTIVLYQGASYTSKQAVPKGIAITDERFWVLTGNYNAQVEAYRREVERFDGRITDNAEAIKQEAQARKNEDGELAVAITLEVGERQREDAAIETAYKAADAAIETAYKAADAAIETAYKAADAAINEKLNSITANNWVTTSRIASQAVTAEKISDKINPYTFFENHNVVFIGDSYTAGTGASDHGSGDTKRFSSILAAKLKATEFNYGVGSTGFCDPGSGGQNMPFKSQVQNALSKMTADEINKTHLVVIAGGVNDFNEGGTYSGAAMTEGSHDAVTNAINGFPNAIVLLVPMLFKGNGLNPRLINFETAIINGIVEFNGTRRAKYIQGAWSWNFGIKSRYASDNLHPNDAGHKQIANMLYANIFGGLAYEQRLIIPTWESGYGAVVNDGGYFQFMNGVLNSYGLYLNNTVEIPGNTQLKIGSIPMGFVQPVSGIVQKRTEVIGAWQITAAGNIYIKLTETLSAGDRCFLSPISAIPSGYVV